MRTTRRPRRYIPRQWVALLAPAFRYSRSRDAFVLRGFGSSLGPVLRADRRSGQHPFEGSDRRATEAAREHARVA